MLGDFSTRHNDCKLWETIIEKAPDNNSLAIKCEKWFNESEGTVTQETAEVQEGQNKKEQKKGGEMGALTIKQVRIVTITEPRQAGLLAAAVNAEQSMSFGIKRDERGKVEGVDVYLECENGGLYELLEMLKENWQVK